MCTVPPVPLLDSQTDPTVDDDHCLCARFTAWKTKNSAMQLRENSVREIASQR